MKELLTKSIGLLFSIEHEDFKVNHFDAPFLYTNKGAFLVCSGNIVDKTKVEITPMSNRKDEVVDYFVIVFVDKQRPQDTSKDVGNTVIIKNNEKFKLLYDDVHEFAKLILFKFWLDIVKVE